MQQQRKARIVTILILGAALAGLLAKRMNWSIRAPKISNFTGKSEPTAQDAIYNMLDAARLGDLRTYLASYSGQMETSLKQSLAETGEIAFVKYLKDSNAAIKGVAISEPQPLSDREVKVRVEYVYQDRNEAQFMYLEKTPAGWKITRVDGIERVKTLVPYGTPVQ